MKIYGGTVTATGKGGSSAIGYGEGAADPGSLTLGDTAHGIFLRAGTVNGSSVNWAAQDERVTICQTPGSVRIEPCIDHSLENHVCICCSAAVMHYVDAEGRDMGEQTVFPLTGETTAWQSGGWYAATEDVTISERVRVSGTVNLILADDTELTIPRGITNNTNANLTIWAQSTGDYAGKLTIKQPANGHAGIGTKFCGSYPTPKVAICC